MAQPTTAGANAVMQALEKNAKESKDHVTNVVVGESTTLQMQLKEMEKRMESMEKILQSLLDKSNKKKSTTATDAAPAAEGAAEAQKAPTVLAKAEYFSYCWVTEPAFRDQYMGVVGVKEAIDSVKPKKNGTAEDLLKSQAKKVHSVLNKPDNKPIYKTFVDKYEAYKKGAPANAVPAVADDSTI